MWKSQAVLAVVPARGGSKGIPRKNLQRVGDRTLVAWAAWTVGQLEWVDAAVLTTDDPEIAEEGARHGLEVPFMRPARLAGDAATGVATWRHAWLAAEERHGRGFPLSVYLQPTTPLRRPEDVTRTLADLVEGGYRAATTVALVPGHFVPDKLLALDANGAIRPYAGERVISNRQDAPRYYYRTGACYAALRETVVERQQIVEERCAGVLVEDYTVNIDDPIDLAIANCLVRDLDRAGGEE